MEPTRGKPRTGALRVTAAQVAIVAALLAVWEFGPVDVQLFSRPSSVVVRGIELWHGVRGLPPLWSQVLETLAATLIGLTAGLALGYAAGIAIAEFRPLDEAVAPYLAAINAVPRVAWVPVLTLVFGFGLVTKIVMSLLIVFFVVFFNVRDAAANTPEALLRGVRALGGGRWHSMRDVRAWAGIGAVLAALPSAVSFALVGVVFAESLSAESGLGALMFNATHAGNARDLMISALLLAVIGLLLVLAVRILQRILRYRLPIALKGDTAA